MAQRRSQLLLVDDAPEIGLIVRHLFRRTGRDLCVVTDAEAAWAELQSRPETPPDLVFLDVNLPGQSGPDFCRQLRADPTWARLPIALFSHWERPDDLEAGLAAGADYLLVKDLLCDPDEWHLRITEILDPTVRPDFTAPSDPPPTTEWTRLLRAAWQRAVVQRTGAGAGRVLANRALARVGLMPRSLVEALDILARSGISDLGRFASGLAEQAWGVTGREGSLALLEAHAAGILA